MEKWVQIFKRPVVFEVLSQIDGPVGFQVTKGFHHVESPTVIAGFSLPIPPPSFVAIPQTLRKSWLYDASTWFATQWVHGAAWFEGESLGFGFQEGGDGFNLFFFVLFVACFGIANKP
ncbi:hypothetical protein RHMOL_Rhmol03G0193400 [Rhododendron molle]|uniref:Uncharacterized protein n=1 Tax=Rhododendron molle TaxID=49168 RepID=A0ACC0PHL9_RHOML|nr:hypothetical protein RHMOL_Rhmol03G0193400 [Rhododendron molle]